MKTLRAPGCEGTVMARCRSSRTSSIPRLEAASISTTVGEIPSRISRHETHSPHGVGVGPRSQLRARASRRAALVLPVPRGPLNR